MAIHSNLDVMQAPDWSQIPAPTDDGAANHLTGMQLPDVALLATNGSKISLRDYSELTVLYVYPMTARPGIPLPDDWDEIPGARGCTPQSCAFRDHSKELLDLGVRHLFGLSVQSREWQQEAAARLHLPFPLLSDENFEFADAVNLPRFQADGMTLLKRMALIIRDGVIEKTFYPVFPPDKNAIDVVNYLRGIKT